MRIVCWQTILMKHHTLFFQKLGKTSQNLSSAALVIGALRVKEAFVHGISIKMSCAGSCCGYPFKTFQ